MHNASRPVEGAKAIWGSGSSRPANNATLNNIALAVVFHHGFRRLPEASLHFMMRRKEAHFAIAARFA